MNSDKNKTLAQYKGRDYRVQESKGWRYIVVKENGKRKLIGLSTLDTTKELLESLLTIEGWEKLASNEKNISRQGRLQGKCKTPFEVRGANRGCKVQRPYNQSINL